MHWQPSDDLDSVKLGSAEEERRRAKGWMDTAAQHSRNEAYWRVRALKAEGAPLSAEDETLLEVMNKMPANTHEGDQTIDVGMREALDATRLAQGKVAYEVYSSEFRPKIAWESIPEASKKLWARIADAVVKSTAPDW